jgi:hypothetical protein
VDGRHDRRRARALTIARVRLDAGRSYKPLDVGNGIVAGTLTAGGRWLELGIAHPRHGRVIVTDAPAFDAARRLDQPAVRAYRAALASPSRVGFGLAMLSGDADAALVADAFPLAIRPTVEVLAVAPPGRRGAVQLVTLSFDRDTAVTLEWTGRMRLARAAYTQLTPGGPLPEVDEHPRLERADGVLSLADETLGAAVAIALPADVVVPAGARRTLVLALAFGSDRDDARAEAKALAASGEDLARDAIERRTALWAGAELAGHDVERRAVAYALDCAACEVGPETTAVLADHEILPLVWTRDAYYVCRALMAIVPERGADLTARFLKWCFETAERPDGWWPRASLASGQAKDPVFQLDQQLYPLLLLEDHRRITRDDALGQRYATQRDAIFRTLLERRSPFGLVATAETPADDPIEAPYHFSSHVLLWRVLRELDGAAAKSVRDATLEHFASGETFAYAVRGARADGAIHYHDANDLPTAFAPGWGFCSSDDRRWRATIDFGWSDANRAFLRGPYGGLGSVHTLHPWSLGDLQELVLGRVLFDKTRAARARARLQSVRTWDGLLPEAYDEASGAVASRHWFAWPIALWALLEREPRLTAP